VCVILPIFIPYNLARGQRPSLRGHLVLRISDLKSEKNVFDLSLGLKFHFFCVCMLLPIFIPYNLARGQRPSLRGHLVLRISDMKSKKKVFDLSSESKVPYVCVLLPILIPYNLAIGQRPSLRGHLVIRISI